MTEDSPVYDATRIWIPLLPDRALSSNGAHGSHHAVSAARRELRAATKYAVWSQYPPAQVPRYTEAVVDVEYRRTRKKPRDRFYRPMDTPNAVSACKPVFDGLVDAGVLEDDDWLHMTLGTFRIVPVHRLQDEGIMVSVRIP